MRWRRTLIFIPYAWGLLIGILIVAFTVWRVHLSHDLDRELSAIHAAGQPTSGEELDCYYTHIPDGQNAAIVMEQAFALAKNYSDNRSNELNHFKVISYDQPLSPEQVALLDGYVALNLNVLATLHEAVRIPDCRYPIDLSQGMDTKLPHLRDLETVSSLEEYRALLDLNAGRQNEITRTILDTLNVAHTLDREPLIISQLVRMRIQNIAVEILEHRLNVGEMPEPERTNLYTAFVAAEKTNSMALALIGERAMALPYFHLSLTEMERLGGSADTNDVIDGGAPLSGRTFLPFEWSGFYGRDERFYLQAMRTNIMLETMIPPSGPMIYDFEQKVFAACTRHYYIFSALLLPAASAAFNREATGLAELRAARLALQVEVFRAQRGRLPRDLNDLVPRFIPAVLEDPFDGQPMRYHTLTNGYVIYSVGRDLHDNGGRERPPDAKSSDKTEYDITFTVHR